MADVDYDAPRAAAQPEGESLELLGERRAELADDLADTDFTGGYLLAGYDSLDDEELAAPVIAVQPDEFQCGDCFLVLRRALHADTRRGEPVCRDCA